MGKAAKTTTSFSRMASSHLASKVIRAISDARVDGPSVWAARQAVNRFTPMARARYWPGPVRMDLTH